MGCQNGEEEALSAALSDALLFTTMCIIGLPVEVQVKDGSTYSGVFHTACAEKDYGIVLKKARMTRKGNNNANTARGALIDTLVILSGDLVQVVVKEVLLSADGIVGNVAGDVVESITKSVCSRNSHHEPEREAKTLKTSKVTSKRFQPKDTFKVGETGSLDQNNEISSAYGLRNTNFEDASQTAGEKGLDAREVKEKPLESVLEVKSEKIDGIYTTKIEEASAEPVVTGDERQAGKDKLQGKSIQKGLMIYKAQRMSSITDACFPQQQSVDGVPVKVSSNMLPIPTNSRPASPSEATDSAMPSSTGFPLPDVLASNVSTSFFSIVDAISSSASPTAMVPSNNSGSNANAKEFKLNPGAKTFSPSIPNPRSAPPAAPTVGSIDYVPRSSPVVHVAGAQTGGIEIGPFLGPRSSLPVKFVHYNNLVAGNSGSGSQYSQPIVGHVGSRQPSVRYSGQYHPVQAGATYVHPNSQAVMVGHYGQLVYVHPISHDAVQGAAALAQGPVRPLLTPHQVHLQKHQGTTTQALQLCVPPPYISGGHQPFAVPAHIPISQPVSTIRPLQIPAGNTLFSSKF